MRLKENGQLNEELPVERELRNYALDSVSRITNSTKRKLPHGKMSIIVLSLILMSQFGFQRIAYSKEISQVFVDNNAQEIKACLSDGTTTTILRSSEVKAKYAKHLEVGKQNTVDLLGNKMSNLSLSPNRQLIAFSIPGHLKQVEGILDLKTNNIVYLNETGRVFWHPGNEIIVIDSPLGETGLEIVSLYNLVTKQLKTLYAQDPNKDQYPIKVSSVTWSSKGESGAITISSPRLKASSQISFNVN